MSLEGSDAYKVADISVWLDGKLFVHKFKINAAHLEYPFSVETTSLQNGFHMIKAEAINATVPCTKSMHRIWFLR